ncbi:UbiA family prenyltransferase [Deinococcus peraridilitoris]|uniref:4-hydroxybenzoate polyprenyltransferase-like prenyltransferase n=1 Tax=Deinococcus peraridilitoris (strain DSM 19664 / LMG 22246 / CIP 109416 / KR-200) TaxID=937777 RepID=L0A434_DEIPD|nr:UbiA family prenyltransferase [Deinococcus peraridilitoris]AFZ68591.1 4-hydroxybenzoate polyprenyltransferase-like prenyltransferase [Deinococcus peraridilitoris DSM 19664]
MNRTRALTPPAPLAPARLARQLLLVSRPALWINTVGVGVVGLWLAGSLWSWEARWLVLLLWLTFPYNLLIYGLNDCSDRAEDAVSERKGGWQGARLEAEHLRPLLWAIPFVNAPFVLYFVLAFPSAALLTLTLAMLLFTLYSLPPVRFKSRPLLDSLSNVAYALPVLVPAQLLGQPWPLWPLLALMAWSVGKHAFDAVQDLTADRSAGVRTVATTLGVVATARWSLGWFVLAGALLLPVSELSACSVWLMSGALSLRLLRDPREATARRLYPLSLLSPWLLGAVAGVQLVYQLARAVAS